MCLGLLALLTLFLSPAFGARQSCGTLDLRARATQHCFPDDGKPSQVVSDVQSQLIWDSSCLQGARIVSHTHSSLNNSQAYEHNPGVQGAITTSAVWTLRQLRTLPRPMATPTHCSMSSPSTATPAAIHGARARRRCALPAVLWLLCYEQADTSADVCHCRPAVLYLLPMWRFCQLSTCTCRFALSS